MPANHATQRKLFEVRVEKRITSSKCSHGMIIQGYILNHMQQEWNHKKKYRGGTHENIGKQLGSIDPIICECMCSLS